MNMLKINKYRYLVLAGSLLSLVALSACSSMGTYAYQSGYYTGSDNYHNYVTYPPTFNGQTVCYHYISTSQVQCVRTSRFWNGVRYYPYNPRYDSYHHYPRYYFHNRYNRQNNNHTQYKNNSAIKQSIRRKKALPPKTVIRSTEQKATIKKH